MIRWNDSQKRTVVNMGVEGSWLQNTRRLLRFHPSLTLRYRPKPSFSILFTGDYNLSLANQEVLQSRGFAHIRFTFLRQKPIQWEAFLQGQRNEIWALQFRGIVGSGFRFFFLQKDSLKWYGGIYPFYEWEVILDTTLVNQSVRLSWNLTWYQVWRNGTTLGLVIYFQPRVDAWEDFRIAADLQWKWKITSFCSFVLSGWLNYDAFPPNQVNTTFYSLTPGLQVTF